MEDTLAQASKAGGRAGIRVFEAILCCNHDRVVDLDVAVHLASVLARRSLPTAGGETVERLGARAVEGGATPLTVCMYVCMHGCMYVCMHTNIHTLKHRVEQAT